MFGTREEAGRALAEAVAALDPADPVVLALPRGGVPVAAPVARRLHAPLDVVLVRKIGLPGQSELAAGAVVDGETPVTVWNEEVLRATGLRPADLDAVRRRELDRIAARRRAWFEGRSPPGIEGRSAIVVDDGIATGATMRAALQALREQGPARLVLAVPVAPQEAQHTMRGLADDIVILETPAFFRAVGAHYRIFDQVSDEAVAELLETVNAEGREP